MEAVLKALANDAVLERQDGGGKATGGYLHLSLHGMDDSYGYDFMVGTCEPDRSVCSAKVREWIIGKLKGAGYSVPASGEALYGDPSLMCHVHGDPDDPGYGGFGGDYNVVQLEMSRTMRTKRRDQVVELLSWIVDEFGRLS